MPNAPVLESAGYIVHSFCDPKAVLDAFNQATQKPAVLVTDYDMGETNGLDLISALHKVQPGLKTVLLSGTVDSSIVLRQPAQVHRFLSKPYQAIQLRAVVEELLRA